MGFYSQKDLVAFGFSKLGSNVLISDKASIYNAKNISIGSNVRIDDYSILSAGKDGIDIGNHVHIACYVSLIGKAKIILKNYVGVSSRTAIYSSSDDYSGKFLTGPTVAEEYKNVDHRPVVLENHVIIGTQCTILPGVTINEGTAIGSLSLVSKDVDSWGIYVGAPLKFLKTRSKDMLVYLL